uniref:RRM domain-containing protein n=1 Tax=Sphenodon punctatus TaxID=8508 RepID=A0A8D0LD27_SPHPU
MRQAGEVTYADAHKGRKNEGVIEFKSYSDMKRALEKLDGTEVNGRKNRLVEDPGLGPDVAAPIPEVEVIRDLTVREGRAARLRSVRAVASGTLSTGWGPALVSKTRSRSKSRSRSASRSCSQSRARSRSSS